MAERVSFTFYTLGHSLKTKATCSSKMLVPNCNYTRYHKPADCIPNSHQRKNQKFYALILGWSSTQAQSSKFLYKRWQLAIPIHSTVTQNNTLPAMSSLKPTIPALVLQSPVVNTDTTRFTTKKKLGILTTPCICIPRNSHYKQQSLPHTTFKDCCFLFGADCPV